MVARRFFVYFGVAATVVAWCAGLTAGPLAIAERLGEPWGFIAAGTYLLAYLSLTLALITTWEERGWP